MKNVAVLIHSESEIPKESFVLNHIKHLPFNVFVFYSGYVPYKCKGVKESKLVKLFYSVYDSITSKATSKVSSFHKRQFKKGLKNKKIDIVLAEYLVIGGFVTDLCKEMGVPLISTALGYDISKYKVLKENKLRYEKLFNYSSAIIIVSEHMRINLNKLKCPNDKIIYSPAGPEKSFFSLSPTFENKQLFALGRFVDKKAPYLTILAFSKALEKVDNAVLIMGGDGNLLQVCEDLVKILKIEENVKFIGVISQEEQREILGQSCAFVQHSKVALDGDNEGTPVSILEASAAGIPIISTVHGGIPGVVIHGKTGLLCKENDVDQMASDMITILENKELTCKMGREGREYVRTRFKLENHISKITEAINAAVLLKS